jgi:flagellar biosynthetic protein FlhB
MSDSAGEKTEQPTARRMEDAISHGQIARSAEVQTVFVLTASFAALSFFGRESFQQLVGAMVLSLSHLHDTSLSLNSIQGYAVSGAWLLIKCAGPVVLAAMVGGLLAGGIQSRFQTASEVLTPDWNRLNPVEGFQRVFSARMLAPTGIAITKFAFIIVLTYSEVRSILSDPIFTLSVSVARLGEFLVGVCLGVGFRVVLGLAVIAALDYGYQWWRTHQDLMMTREEVKEDMKSSEGNPLMKAARRRRRRSMSKAKSLATVPKADVVVTNPTHIAVALRYDRKTMKAPEIVAKGIRLNAQIIREIAQQHQIPIIENKPLARMLFKHGKVGGEIPAQLYAAVAEVLAWVYRVNRYRYYAEQNQTEPISHGNTE